MEKCNALFRNTERLSHKHSLFGFVVVLPNSEYEQHYKITGKRPKGTAIPDSKYGLCFRYAMSVLGALCEQIFKQKDITLHVVMEAGHPNSGDAERIFHLMKGKESLEYFRKILGTISFAEKDESYEVQAADGLAYTAYGLEEYPVEVVAHSIDQVWDASRKVAAKQRKDGRKVRPTYRLLFNTDQLKELKTHLFLKNPLPLFQVK